MNDGTGGTKDPLGVHQIVVILIVSGTYLEL